MGSQNSKHNSQLAAGGNGGSLVSVGSQATSVRNSRTLMPQKGEQLVGRPSAERHMTTQAQIFQPHYVLVGFRWSKGGSEVLLTGTFTNWTDHIPMERQGDEFIQVLRLPPGTYQYKFIVDGIWTVSNDDKTTFDAEGNLNNVVDTSLIYGNGDLNPKTHKLSNPVSPKFSPSPPLPEKTNGVQQQAPGVLPVMKTEKKKRGEEEGVMHDEEPPKAPPNYLNAELLNEDPGLLGPSRRSFLRFTNELDVPKHVVLYLTSFL
eukprot:TRINITY_DN2023_c0_g1_i3.p1 TRINITY_DN2023_c0_g1~~TRINITY_DN2023_c0_g1_i3.p1  ORF type:complete len:261 (-),score=32.28 TRINITY_DN2023_c0_g1_i3:312-1094(-)